MRRSFPLLLSTLVLSNWVFASTVTLHLEPKTDSPAVASVDLSQGIVPIYTPTGSDWVKVADPKNGNVGWIKQSDFNTANTASINISQQPSGGKVNTIQMQSHVGKPINMNDPKVKSNLDEMRKLQENVEKNMKENINSMVKGMNELYQKQLKMLQDNGYDVNSNTTAAPVTSATPAPVNGKSSQ